MSRPRVAGKLGRALVLAVLLGSLLLSFSVSQVKAGGETVRTTDSTYATVKTSFMQGETVYATGIGYNPGHGNGAEKGKWYMEFFYGTTLKYTSPWITATSTGDITYGQALSPTDPTGTWTIKVYCAEHNHLHGSTTFTVTPYVPPTCSVTFDAVAASPLPDVAGTTVIVTGTIGGVPFTVTNAELSKTFTGIASGTTVSYSYNSPIPSTITGKQHRWLSTSGTGSASGQTGQSGSFSLTSNSTVTATYKTQYTLTMDTNFGTTSPSAGDTWENAGTVVDISATPPVAGAGENYVFNGWMGTGSGSYTGSNQSTSVTMSGPIIENASWTRRYTLTMDTNFGTTSPSVGDTWENAGTVVDISATAPVAGAGERYVFDNWTGTGTTSYTGTSNPATGMVTMNGAITETASWTYQYTPTIAPNSPSPSWTHQYYLTVTSLYGTKGGAGWYDSGATAYATVTPLTVDGPAGVRYVFTGWSIDATGTTSPSDPITMDGPKTATAVWKTQYYLTVNNGSHGTAGGAGWYNNGDITQATVDPLIVDGENGVQYVFTHWSDNALGITSPSNPINMDSPKTATANWFKIENKYTVSKWDNYGIGFAAAGSHVHAHFDNVYVENIDFDVKENIKNAQIIVLQLVNRPSGISIGPADNPYGYLEVILINLNENDIENIVLTFKVEKSWISANSIDESKMTLNSWDNTDNTWTSYHATKIGEDDNYSYFSVNLPHLSTFVIGGSRLGVVAPPTVIPLSASLIFLIAIIATGALVGAVVVRRRYFLHRGRMR